ncbi:Multidrug efflux pump subunit AcrB [Methylobrevis pamukkalensis]|uniref:Multidrug efflux pump subunit AcrB n=1 Tax=Methylobrevis pamukkalensis TaxID=1439726 RepID=A0A1E3GWI3_9HYPH|nr:Multidrug efflux pump subunit AcrB [Methylobrevis pamukkalensis]
MLKPVTVGHARGGLFGMFNRGFDRTAQAYGRGVGGLLRRPLRMLAVFLLICGAVFVMFRELPSSFLPPEDQGMLMTMIELPSGASSTRTRAVVEQVERYYLEEEKAAVDSVFATIGFSFSGSGQNAAIAFVKLKDFAERSDPALSAAAVSGRAMRAFSQIRDGRVIALAPPAIPNLGTSSGFNMYLQDTAGAGHAALVAARTRLLELSRASALVSGVRQSGQEDQAQFKIDVDQERAGALGVDLSDINTTLSVAYAGRYVNDFINQDKIRPVYVQADAPFRMSPESFADWQVRNGAGDMVPFSAFAGTSWTFGSPKLDRYNGISAVGIEGAAPSGVSSGDAMTEMDRLVGEVGGGFTSAWTGLSYQEEISGNQAPALYAISMLVVFLCLAALYESWSIPFSVMLAVPIGVLGALAAATLFGQSNDVYFKVGLLTTIGLAAKNAILIVEFAKELEAGGRGLVAATVEASLLRLRPILMTSFAFILGVLPLAIASGAGSGAQNAVGIGVMGGMIAATFLGIFFVPLFYVTVRAAVAKLRKTPDAGAPEAGTKDAVAGDARTPVQ